jgi:pilus assembly protein CpaB
LFAEFAVVFLPVLNAQGLISASWVRTSASGDGFGFAIIRLDLFETIASNQTGPNMRLQNVFTIVALAALAALVFLVVRSITAPGQNAGRATNVERQGAAQSNLPQIWVARDDLKVGSFVAARDLEAHDWPPSAILPGQLRVGQVKASEIAGAVVRQRIAKGEPVLMAKLVKPGDRGFLSAVLLPGMRAVSIGVDSVSADSGLVLPGDRVDVILTQRIGGSDAPGRAHVSETILRAVKVLAVGTRLSPPADSKEVDDRPKTVTLQVTPKQAQALEVASSIGSLSLSLRSLPQTKADAMEDELATKSADLSKPKTPMWASDVSHALSGGGGGGVQIMRGSTPPSAH